MCVLDGGGSGYTRTHARECAERTRTLLSHTRICQVFPPVTTEAFRRQFERALIPYTKGNWQEAKEQLEKCLEQVPDDKPALHILKVMGEHSFQSPPSWKGYRDADDV